MNRESGLGISVASIAAQSSGSRHGAIGRPSSTSITTARSMNTLTLVCAAGAAIQADAGGLACGFEPGRRRRRSHCYKQDWESFYSAFNNYDPDPEIPRYS